MIDLQDQVYHFHPRSSDWNELSFLDVMLNLGEESRVPALHPLELLGLDDEQKKVKPEVDCLHLWNLYGSYRTVSVGRYLRASKDKVWVLLH